MRRTHLIATVLVVVAVGGATAYANHVEPLDPETVPLGVFTAHNRVSNISTAALVLSQVVARAQRRGASGTGSRLPDRAVPRVDLYGLSQ